MVKKFKIKQGKTSEDLQMVELSDDALDAVSGGTSQTDLMTCTCDECGAVINGEDGVMNHYITTGHCSYHWNG